MPAAVPAPRSPVARAFEVISIMVDGGSVSYGVRELAEQLDLPPTTVHRALRALEQGNLVEHDETSGRYALGLEFFRIAWRATDSNQLRDASIPVLETLAARAEETVLLGAYDTRRREMLFAASVVSQHSLRYVVELNKWVPVWRGATGLAIMAHLSKDDRQAILEQAWREDGSAAARPDPAEFERELEAVRERGYAISYGERIAGAVGIAAPVWGSDRSAIGDIGVTIPNARFEPASEPLLANMVMEAAAEVTARIGGVVPGTTP
jgi:IclR family acetate operon transcriptional repressor